jgi:hypothetical protein
MQSKKDLIAALKASLSNGDTAEAPAAPKVEIPNIPVSYTEPQPVARHSEPNPFSKVRLKPVTKAEPVVEETVAVAEESPEETPAGDLDYLVVDTLEDFLNFVHANTYQLREAIRLLRVRG